MMNGFFGKTKRILSLMIALVMVFGLFGTVSIAENGQPQGAQTAFYLVGSMNEWSVSEEYRLSPNNGADTEEYLITLDLKEGDEFKVTNRDKTTWYPDGADNNYKIEEAGSYTVYFRPNYDGEEKWHYSCLYAEKGETPAQSYRITTLTSGEGTVTVPIEALQGETVIVTVAAAEGYTLRALKVDGLDVTAAYLANGSYSFTMPGYSVTVEAVFDAVAEGSYYIYVNVYGLGTAFADKTTAEVGDTITITAEGSIGYVFKQMVVNDVAMGDGVTTFSMPDADAIVNVYFVRTPYTITLSSGVQGTMNAIPRNNQAFADTTVQIIVNANEDYAVKKLTVRNDNTGDSVEVTLKEKDGQTSIYEFTMPDAPVTVTATYRKAATNGYYLIGQYGWTADDIDGNDKFVDDLSVSGQMLLTVDLVAGQEIKVVKVVDGKIDTWYPKDGPNYTITAADAGTSVIYFRPGYGGGDDWFQNCFYVKHLPYDFYLVDIASGQIRQDDKLFINKEFNGNEVINKKGETIHGLYGAEYEHMVLTWLESGDKIKVVKVQNGAITEWLPDGMGLEYPTFRYSDNEYQQDPEYTGMVFVFFEEQIGKVTGYDGQIHYPRVDWTNHVFDVQKAYKADAAEKSSVNPLNAESLTYNLVHGSISLSTGTPFIRDSRENETNIIYELALNQKVYCSIIAEAGYALDGTPYITYDGNTVNMTEEGNRWYFTMPAADVVIHAPMRKVFRTQSVLLSGQIGVNFFVDLTGLDTSKCEMHFKVGKSTKEQIDTFDPNFHSSITKTNFGFTCFINAIQMADDITAELYCDGKLISAKQYSLEEYVKYFERSDSTQDGNVAALRIIRAMIDFGYYAQKYLFSENTSLAQTYTEVKRYYATQYDFESIRAMTESHSLSKAENKNISDSDIDRITLQLALDSATALLINLYMKENTESVPEIRVGSETLTPTSEPIVSGRYTWSLTDTTSGGTTRRYQLRIEGISPHNLDQQFSISGTAGGAFTIKASAFSYVNIAIASSNEKLQKLGAALYMFHKAEVEYRQSGGYGN